MKRMKGRSSGGQHVGHVKLEFEWLVNGVGGTKMLRFTLPLSSMAFRSLRQKTEHTKESVTLNLNGPSNENSRNYLIEF